MSLPKRISQLDNELIDMTKETWFIVEQTGGSAALKVKRQHILGGGVGFVATDPNQRILSEDSDVFLQLSVETYDDFAALASDTFTVPVTGLYLIEFVVGYTTQPGGRLRLALYDGAALVAQIFQPITPEASSVLNVQWSTVVRLTKAHGIKFLLGRPDDGNGPITLNANTVVKCHLV